MRKKYIYFFIILILFLLISLIVFIISNNSLESILQLIKDSPLIGPFLLILWRILGILFPAIPAGVISFAAVPIFGWLKTYLYTLTGILIGASTSFLLARKFRESLVGKFAPLKKIHEFEDELSKKEEFFAILTLRLFSAPVMDFSSYAAGLSKISFRKFILATFIASLPDIAIFYFGEQLYKTFFGRSVIAATAVLFIIGAGYFIFKKFILDKKK